VGWGEAGMGRAVVGLRGRDDWGGVGDVVGVVRVGVRVWICGGGSVRLSSPLRAWKTERSPLVW